MSETTSTQHAAVAEEYLEEANQLRLEAFESPADYTGERMALIAMAQVHATLATVPEPSVVQF